MKKHPLYGKLRTALGFSPPMDGLLSMAFGRPVVDLPAFEDCLKKYYKQEYTDSISMNEFIEMQFGTGALDLLNKML